MKRRHKDFYQSLSNRKIISKLIRSGGRLQRGGIFIRYLPLVAESSVRAEIVWAIPRSVGNAVKRNRVRRVLRMLFFEIMKDEQLQEKLLRFPSKKFYLAITPRSEFLQKSYTEQKKDMRNALTKLFLER